MKDDANPKVLSLNVKAIKAAIHGTALGLTGGLRFGLS
jgi:hypothetical protein